LLHGEKELKDLLNEEYHDPDRDLEARNSVYQTWKIFFDQIMLRNPRAADLFSLMAVLDRQGIPKSLVRRSNENAVEFTKALGILQTLSLIIVEQGDTTFQLRRVVQLSAQTWLEIQGTIGH